MANENNQQNANASQQDVLSLRREKFLSMRAEGTDPYTITSYPVDTYARDITENFDKFNGKEVCIAGRLMSKRVMGKASFTHIQDSTAQIQCYVSRDELGEDDYAFFKKHQEIGDIIGVKGNIFLTQTGAISVHAKEFKLLSKSLQILPEKFHGLTDQELRYRQRYLDLIMNPEVKDTFVKRSLIITEIRNFLNEKGYIEVDTPILTPIEIGAAARPFVTHHNTLDIDMYLRIETELYLKRLIVGGFDRVYEVGRIFRNEGMDKRHNPEFTSVELYQAYTDYKGMMDIVTELYPYLAKKVCGTTKITYQGVEMDLAKWEKLTMVEAVKKYAGVDYNDWKCDNCARKAAGEKGVEVPADATKGTVLVALFEAFVEDNLIQPTIIYDYPVENSPLAKRKPSDPAFTERFEYFICASEMGNAFSELNDPIDQKERFEKQVAAKRLEDPNTTAQIDDDFINALEYGMPPTGGLGFGVDRLIMVLTDSATIRDVLLFPTMKSLDGQKDSGKAQAKSNEPAQEAAPVEQQNAVEEKIDFSNVVIEPLFEDFVDFETFSKSDFRAVKVLECEAVPKSKKLLKFTLDDGTGVNRTILSGIHAFYEPEELVGKTLIAITNLPPRAMMGIDSCGMLLSAINKRGEEEELHLLMVDNHIPAGAKLY